MMEGFNSMTTVTAYWMGLIFTMLPSNSGKSLIRGDVWYIIYCIGTSLLCFAHHIWGLIGGVLMAFTLPGMWMIVLEDLQLTVQLRSTHTRKGIEVTVVGRFTVVAITT